MPFGTGIFGGSLFGLTAGPPGRYWVGGTGNWTDTAHWSASSGGPSGASVPTGTQDVFFDSNSGTGVATVNTGATRNCRSIDCDGITGRYAGTLTVSVLLNVGSTTGPSSGVGLRFSPTMTLNGTANIQLAHTVANAGIGWTVTSAGLQWPNNAIFAGTGRWQLNDNLDCSPGVNGQFQPTTGTVDLNGHMVKCKGWQSNNTNVRALNFGGGNVTIVGTGATLNGTNFTFGGFTGGDQVILSPTAASTNTFTSVTGFPEFVINSADSVVTTVAIGTAQLTCNTLTVNGQTGSTTGAISLGLLGISTSGTATFQGAPLAGRGFLVSGTRGSMTNISAFTYIANYFNFLDVAFAGAGAPISGTEVASLNRCTGITSTTPATQYWVGGAGNWSDQTHWASTSGGVGGTGRVPLGNDPVIFDASSGAGICVCNCNVLGAGWDFNGNVSLTPQNMPVAGNQWGPGPYVTHTTFAGWNTGAAGWFAQLSSTDSTQFTGGAAVVTHYSVTWQGPGIVTQQDNVTWGAGMSVQINAEFRQNGFRANSGGTILLGFGNSGTYKQGSGDIHFTGTGTLLATTINASLFDGGTGTVFVDDTSVTTKTFLAIKGTSGSFIRNLTIANAVTTSIVVGDSGTAVEQIPITGTLTIGAGADWNERVQTPARSVGGLASTGITSQHSMLSSQTAGVQATQIYTNEPTGEAFLDVTDMIAAGAIPGITSGGTLSNTTNWWTSALIDNEGLTDNTSQTAVYNKTISDNEGLTDAETAVVAYLRTISDNEGLTDSVTRIMALTLTDPEGLTDLIIPIRNVYVTISDGLGATDSLTRDLARALFDGEGLTDAMERAVQRFLTDPEALTDTLLINLFQYGCVAIALTEATVDVDFLFATVDIDILTASVSIEIIPC